MDKENKKQILIKMAKSDFLFKRNKAQKYLNIFYAIKDDYQRAEQGKTLLDKAEKWSQKAQKAKEKWDALEKPTLLQKLAQNLT